MSTYVRKSRPAGIAVGDVEDVFTDEQIKQLAQSLELSLIDVATFAVGVREAARIYARDSRVRNANEIHRAIANLYKGALDHRYDELAILLGDLSPETREMLLDRGDIHIRLRLPSFDALRDPRRQKAACERIARLCRFGAQRVPGRRRPSGRQSRPVFQPLLQAPVSQRNFPKREAERSFVMNLQLSYLEATGLMPPVTARHTDAVRTGVGPFARFARDCLRLVGATHADVVELINQLRWDYVDLNSRSGRVGPHD